MFSVTFTGFETLIQAREFAEWYSGQGEQDACYWMEEIGVTSCNAKNIQKPQKALLLF